MILQPIIIYLSSTASQLQLSCSGPCPKSHVKGEAGTSKRSHWPAQLGCPQPIQPSLCLVPSLGAVSQAWSFWDRGVGMWDSYPWIEPAQTNGASELDKDPSTSSQALLEQGSLGSILPGSSMQDA